MTFLPIVDRELRVACRRSGAYWMRVGSAVIAIGIFSWMVMLTRQYATSVDMGRSIFVALSVLAFAYCLLVGVRNTADCISEEKREGTLGLLFLTDLKGYDVVLGKLAATSLNSVYGLAAIFPILAIPILLGGTTLEQVEIMVLLLLNTLLFSLSAGIWVSAVSRSERSAAGWTFLLILGVSAGLPVLATLLNPRSPSVWLEWTQMMLTLPSPGFAYAQFFEQFGAPGVRAPAADYFWSSLSTTFAVSVFMLLHAAHHLRHAWQDRPAGTVRLRWRERLQRWGQGDALQRRIYRTALLDLNPVLWLTSRDRLKVAYVWGTLGVLASLWFWGWIEWKRDWIDQGNYLITSFAVHFLLKIWVAREACHRLHADRQSGALELLLATPVSVGEILRGQCLGFTRQFRGPVLLVLLIDVLFIIAGSRQGDAGEWMAAMLVFSLVFVVDLGALAILGLWLGLKSRHATRAVGAVITRLLMLPWFVMGVMATVTMMGSLRMFNTEASFLINYAVVSLGVDLVLGGSAWLSLRQQFRTIAVNRFDTGSEGWWARRRARGGATQDSPARR
jgi:ABC-type transport system involved in cytochrome c biogenesis permease component